MYSVYIYSRIIVITVLYWWAWLTLVIIWSSLYFSVFWIHFLVMVALIIYFWIRLDGPHVVELDARFLGLIKINKQGRSCGQKKFQVKSWTVFFQTDWQCKDGWATTVQWVGGGGAISMVLPKSFTPDYIPTIFSETLVVGYTTVMKDDCQIKIGIWKTILNKNRTSEGKCVSSVLKLSRKHETSLLPSNFQILLQRRGMSKICVQEYLKNGYYFFKAFSFRIVDSGSDSDF